MPFDHGSFTATIFELSADLPSDYLKNFADSAAGTLDSVTDELQVGWVSGRHLLETTIDETTSLLGGACIVSLRKSIRKIPAGLLNAMLRREEIIWQHANNKHDYVPSKVKRELRSELLDKNLQKFPPAVSATAVMIDLASGTVYAAASSQTQIDEFVGVFLRTQQVEPLPFGPSLILQRDFKISVADFPSLELKKGLSGYPTIGRDFLTYLWYCNEEGIKFNHSEYGEFEMAVDGPLCFAGDDPECNGSAEIVVKKGENPLRSAEAKAAFGVGKKLKKAKLMVVRDGQIWTCTFDADRFSFASIKLPEGEKLDADSVMIERVLCCHVFKEAMLLAFKSYAAMMLSKDAEAEVAKIQNWALQREGV